MSAKKKPTARERAAKAASTASRAAETVGPEPMDNSIREEKIPSAITNEFRVAYALQTLVDEFLELFPETPVAYGGINPRNTALSALFDLTTIDADERESAAALLQIVTSEVRVLDVVTEEDNVLVQIRPNPRTQDLRDPFGLADAWLILTDGEDEDEVDELTEAIEAVGE